MRRDKTFIKQQLVDGLEKEKKFVRTIYDTLDGLEQGAEKRKVRSHWGQVKGRALGIEESIRRLICDIEEIFDEVDTWKSESERLDEIAGQIRDTG